MSNAQLAQIHIAKKELQMEDADYRAMLARVAGKTSSKDMTSVERQKVIAEFRRLGWKPENKGEWKQPSSSKQVRKVWAIAKDLDRLGFWVLPWRKGLAALVKKETGIDNPDWLTPAKANQVIEMLKSIQARLKAQGRMARS